MGLTILHKDDCGRNSCPTVYLEKGSDIVVGEQVDSETLAQLGVPPGENAVRIRAEVLVGALEGYRAALTA